MEHQKESTYKKTFDSCLICYNEYYSCKKCAGLCIFSKTFFEKANSNRKLRTSLKSKYYKEEFDYIRNFNPEPQELDQPKKHRKFKAREVEERFSDDDKDEVEFELIQKFRKNPHDYPKIMKDHNINEFDRRSFLHKSGIIGEKTKITGRCSVHRTACQRDVRDWGFNVVNSKHNRKRELVKEGQDFFLKGGIESHH